MAVGLSEKEKSRFPLKTIDAVIDVFRDQLDYKHEPNLALLSILIGILEHSLTVNRPATGEASSATVTDRRQKSHVADANEETAAAEQSQQLTDPVDRTTDLPEKPVDSIPAIEFSDVEALYEQFVTLVKGSVDLSGYKEKYTSSELLKTVSDVVWTALTRTYYKDRAHLHTLYTMLTDNKMDCFGMALGVVAACQILGLSDVHLAFSEDHAWAVFGKEEHSSAEITWHGKGTEDRRGQRITESTAEKSWLYSHPLIGNRHVEVAAMVLNINPAINASYDSIEMAILQQRLLWLLYDLGHLDRYPLALGILADMEEMSPSPGRPASSVDLYTTAISIARKHYSDMHVYPYTYMGNYYYRRCMYKEALSNWAAAAQVISRYNYNKEDEEIYKEFLEIANDIIPNIVRISSGEAVATSFQTDAERSTKSHDSVPFLSDPECYANLLQFYDGICEWEEGSSKPVLHIVWANHMAYSLSKFDLKARENVNVDTNLPSNNGSNSEAGETEPRKRLDRRRESDATKEDGGGSRHGAKSVGSNGDATKSKPRWPPSRRSSSNQNAAEVIASDDSSSGANVKASKTDADNLNEKGSSKASPRDKTKLPSSDVDDSKDKKDVADSEQDAKATSDSGESANAFSSASTASAKTDRLKSAGTETAKSDTANEDKGKTDNTKRKLILRSEKMVGMKELLVSRKLNTSAIKLQLTAQSQLSLKQTQPTVDAPPPQKRVRRE